MRALVTMVPPFPSLDGLRTLSYLRSKRLPHFRTAIRRLAAYEKAVVAGTVVQNVNDPRAERAWEDYAAVGKELLKL